MLQRDNPAGIKRIYMHDDSFWKDDPVDRDHSRKRRVLHGAHIVVDAPYHPAFTPTEQITVPKASLRKVGAPTIAKES
jgi:hypothetical protein